MMATHRVIVAARAPTGDSVFLPVLIDCDDEEFDDGSHFQRANAYARARGCEPYTAWDSHSAPRWLMQAFTWDDTPILSPPPEPLAGDPE